MESFEDHLNRAEGFHDLGLHQEAWDTLEELPPIDRVEPLVLELRLRILTAMEKWDLGEGIANVLPSSAVELQKCRETVARYTITLMQGLSALRATTRQQ